MSQRDSPSSKDLKPGDVTLEHGKTDSNETRNEAESSDVTLVSLNEQKEQGAQESSDILKTGPPAPSSEDRRAREADSRKLKSESSWEGSDPVQTTKTELEKNDKRHRVKLKRHSIKAEETVTSDNRLPDQPTPKREASVSKILPIIRDSIIGNDVEKLKKVGKMRARELAGNTKEDSRGELLITSMIEAAELDAETISEKRSKTERKADKKAFKATLKSQSPQSVQDIPTTAAQTIESAGEDQASLDFVPEVRSEDFVSMKSDGDIPASTSERTVYENLYKTKNLSIYGLNRDRFKSDPKLAKQKHGAPKAKTLWDGEPIVSSKMMERNISNTLKHGANSLLQPLLVSMNIQAVSDKERYNPLTFPMQVTSDEVVDTSELVSYENRKNISKAHPEGSFLYGDEAMQEFKKFRFHDQVIYSGLVDYEKGLMRLQLNEKRNRMERVLEAAREHYTSSSKMRQTLRQRAEKFTKVMSALDNANENQDQKKMKTEIEKNDGDGKPEVMLRTQLEALTIYTPWFIYMMTLLQAIATVVFVALGGVTTISMRPIKKTTEQLTWGGNVVVYHFEHPNIWIGPSYHSMIQLGATFAPCMREDKQTSIRNARYRLIDQTKLGCCEVTGNGAGTTTFEECNDIAVNYKIIDYVWRNSTTCDERPEDIIDFEPHQFKPCCFGYQGNCSLLTQSHCNFLHGSWHKEGIEHCSQAHCDEDTCEISIPEKGVLNTQLMGVEEHEHEEEPSAVPEEEGVAPEPHSHTQYWRLPLSLFYHQGLIHFCMVAMTQILMGVDVEKLSGWLRTGIIYLVSGFGGLLVGSALKPYEPTTGGGGAVMGLIGVNLVELLQSWSLLPSPKLALLKLIAVITLFLLAGIMPQVNQFVQITGLLGGILLSVICLPYVTLNFWTTKGRLILKIIALVILLVVTIVSFFVFVTAQPIKLGALDYLNCIPGIQYPCSNDDPSLE